MKNYQITIKKHWGDVKIDFYEFKGTIRTAIEKFNEIVEDVKADTDYMWCVIFLREGKYSQRLKHRPLTKHVIYKDFNEETKAWDILEKEVRD